MLILDDAYVRKLTANYEGGRFIKTVELVENPVGPVISYWANNPEPITWNGHTYSPIMMMWDNIKTSQGMNIEAATISVSNLAGLVGKYIKQIDVTGNEVTLRLLHADLLNKITGHWERRAKIISIKANQTIMIFSIGRWLGRGVLPRKIYTQTEFPGLSPEVPRIS
jgi:hypothetical protein